MISQICLFWTFAPIRDVNKSNSNQRRNFSISNWSHASSIASLCRFNRWTSQRWPFRSHWLRINVFSTQLISYILSEACCQHPSFHHACLGRSVFVFVCFVVCNMENDNVRYIGGADKIIAHIHETRWITFLAFMRYIHQLPFGRRSLAAHMHGLFFVLAIYSGLMVSFMRK